MQPHSPTTRPGFTLVELLMVIIIIGILAGLLIVAVGPAIGTANTAVVKAEINQLDVALNNYRDTYGSLPPTVFTGNDSIGTIDTVKRFDRHLRKAFPRFRLADLDADMDVDADDYVEAFKQATEFPTGSTYAVTFCDLGTMDAAESLVFWLGGIPKIWKANNTTGEFEVELTGFSLDPTNPLLPETNPPSGGNVAGEDYQSERTAPLFEFDTRRLVDADQDGWPEYIPSTGSAQEAPPYVYFDSASYADLPYYPPFDFSAGVETWGVARPYLIRYTSLADALPLPGSFASAEKFQIICGGADNKYCELRATDSSNNTYGDANNDLTLPQAEVEELVNLLPVYREGTFYNRNVDPRTTGSIDAPQFDNLTNFLESKLENEFNSGN